MAINLSTSIFKNIYFWISILCLLIIAGSAGFYVYRYQPQALNWIVPSNNTPKNGQLSVDETQKVLATVGKLIELPTGETPTIATITDISKLSGQDFFKHAQNGDQVIIYPIAKKAYLYSPSQKKILDVQPISFPSTTPSAQTTPVQTIPTPTFTPQTASPSATINPVP